jgi:hypothetical protein
LIWLSIAKMNVKMKTKAFFAPSFFFVSPTGC